MAALHVSPWRNTACDAGMLCPTQTFDRSNVTYACKRTALRCPDNDPSSARLPNIYGVAFHFHWGLGTHDKESDTWTEARNGPHPPTQSSWRNTGRDADMLCPSRARLWRIPKGRGRLWGNTKGQRARLWGIPPGRARLPPARNTCAANALSTPLRRPNGLLNAIF